MKVIGFYANSCALPRLAVGLLHGASLSGVIWEGSPMKAAIIGSLGFACMIASAMSAPTQAQTKDPPGVNPTHYQCYRVAEGQPFQPRDVKLADQFGASGARVLKPIVLCAPVSKNGAPVRDKRTHLTCYEDEGPKAVDKKVAVTNQFGTETLTVGGPWTLCVPSLKTVPHQ